jgi:hypothetical protein
MGLNNDMAEVLAAVQQKIAAGVLPTDKPMKMWVGNGTGKSCDACDLVVTPADIEYETDLPSGRTLRFHQPCLAVWHEERTRGRTS